MMKINLIKYQKNKNAEIMNVYNELDNYVMSLNSDIKKNTTFFINIPE